MTIDFDKVVSRYGTNYAKWDGMAQVSGREMIALSVADMDLQAPPQVIERVTEMAKHGIYGYTDPFPPYYEAVQGWIKKAYDWEVPQEWIVFCPRIVQAVSLIIQNFTQPGDQVLIHTPAYQPVAKSVELNNRVLVESPLREVNGRYEIDFADMEFRMQAGVKIILLISPHNPVGWVWTRAELERIVSLCTKYDAYIVSDDIHADFIHEGHEHTIIGKISTEAEQRSFSCTSGLHPKNLGRTIEDSAAITEPILPWTAAGAYMAGTLGVATLDYLPWAVLCWTGIIFATIWGFTGFGIAKLTPEQQAEMLKEYDGNTNGQVG
ncbi:MalY/PatB family protein [Paenibacillus pseudetheri]|uniref:cysteine-S-conjugate beta-lyase n=1 Tax=Paenibacillus pseudetheri TaxID=2897682 RepID=A0ABM9B9F7_9BACL|nr:aminotransferase class I/II-fold pyridoxal phosphate-dependent enzyme [Paenibacillus pseudetheri]CAH1055348.1 Histidinol-phosphate aminotransferase [Paenibacillus pseudetheri]